MSTEVLLKEFAEVAEHPHRVLTGYKNEGKKVIGVLPYFAPVELVLAAGMVPMGIWGSNKKTISMAKEYCATFYCTIAQLALEMLLDGTMDQLDGIITPTICDTLRPMSQNFRVAMEGKLPCIFLAHPQYRRPSFGLQFTVDQYMHVKAELEKISGTAITEDGQLVTNGGRVLGVTATGPRLTNALSHAYEAAEKIHFDKLHKRSDIGLRALKALAEKQ